MGRHKVALAVALAIPLAGFGLRPAMAGPGPVCGAVTMSPGTCQEGIRGDIYQRSLTLSPASSGTQSALCDGGPSASDRDTALHDNLFELLIAQTSSSTTASVAHVTDSTGRLVGYTVTGTVSILSGVTLDLYVTCINDH